MNSLTPDVGKDASDDGREGVLLRAAFQLPRLGVATAVAQEGKERKGLHGIGWQLHALLITPFPRVIPRTRNARQVSS